MEHNETLNDIIADMEQYQKAYGNSLRFVLYQRNYKHRVGYCCFNFKDAFVLGLRKFGENNFFIELQADYGFESMVEWQTNIKTITRVTDFEQMKKLSADISFNPHLDIYKKNDNYTRFLELS